MKIICGVDEAGRGCIAGDVFASAVVLDENFELPQNLLLNDSKKISPKNRDRLFQYITSQSVYSIKTASVLEIDSLNILQASLLAMKRAIEDIQSKINIDLVLVDGNQLPKVNIETHPIVNGDSLIPSISAGSILAKVARDRYMLEMDNIYPHYEFRKHKGYPTALHIHCIEKYGICDIHRKTFTPIKQKIKQYV